MNKDIKIAVPKLRFPEFKDAEGWKEIKLIDVTDKKVKWSFIGGPFGSNLKSSDYVPNGIRIIQLQNIGDGEFIDNYKIFTSEEKANELLSNNIYPDDIIMSKMGDPVGRACIIPNTNDRYVMCSDGIRIVVDEKKYSKYFIYSLINSAQFRAIVEKSSTGSTRKRIGLDVLKKLPMVVPKDTKEQQKIADCLTSIDDLINAESQKLDNIKEHKKGLLQQLFPTNGETVPKLRFPEFKDDGDWEEKKLGEIASFYKGKGLAKSEIIPNGENLCIHYGELFTKYQEVIKKVISKTNLATGFKSKINDVLMPTSDVTPNGLAKACCVNLNNVILGGDILVIRTDISTINGEFLSRQIRNKEQKVLQLVTGSTIYHLYASGMEKLNISIPKIEEQQKIANCLSSVDEIISAQSQKVEALKEHKKGLMQQLFPNVNS